MKVNPIVHQQNIARLLPKSHVHRRFGGDGLEKIHRFDLLGWPFDRYPHLSRWFAAASARESYQTALEAWEPKGMLESVAPKQAERRAAGDGIETYGLLAT